MRYGTLPIAGATGGLKDTIQQCEELKTISPETLKSFSGDNSSIEGSENNVNRDDGSEESPCHSERERKRKSHSLSSKSKGPSIDHLSSHVVAEILKVRSPQR